MSAHPVRWIASSLFKFALMLGCIVAMIVGLGIAQRQGWLGSTTSATPSENNEATPIHTCPMHPQIRQPGPGRCPICGMPLVPATSGAGNQDELAVNIEPVARRLANIQTAEATLKPMAATINTIGMIEVDESRQAVIASYIAGRVERLFADYTGVEVKKGDHLAVIYSPQLYAAQVEYLESRKSVATMSTNNALASVQTLQRKLVESSKQKLVELGMTTEQLQQLEQSGEAQSRLTIYAPIGGTVIDKQTQEGKYINVGESLYRIANLSTVWLMLELYPEDASRIRFGQTVQGTLKSMPNEVLTGRVAFIDPVVDPMTRTVGVRVEFDNSEGKLRPGDYAEAKITVPIGPQGSVYDAQLAGKWISPMHPQVIRDEPGDCPICGMKLVPTTQYGYSDSPVKHKPSLIIPRSALLLAGESSVVYVETEPGRFEIRVVKIGPILKDQVVIESGIEEGEQVATAGNFLIDSQMQIAGNPSLIDPTRAKGKHYRNKPMEFASITIEPVPGESGKLLERLYDTYFQIQKRLTEDKKPTTESVHNLKQLAEQLQKSKLPTLAIESMNAIVKQADMLANGSLDEIRQQFKPISHAVVTLSTQVRGEGFDQPFKQFFCPMVKQGEGDWLQAEGELVNPYYGSAMLNCGELVRTIPSKPEVKE